MNHLVLSLALFIVTIALLVTNIIDRVIIVLLGVLAMIFTGVFTPIHAFSYIDWNVIGILLGMWIITQYMIESKIPDMIVYKLSGRTNCFREFVLLMFLTAGFISMFVDNVLVILLFGTIMIRACYSWKRDPVLPVILIGLAANFMGTALLLGDLPPQLLHSIGGVEFLGFIYFMGKPSSFPLLTISFVIMAYFVSRFIPKGCGERVLIEKPFFNTSLATVSLFYFLLTVFLMSIRPFLGVPLGYITLSMAVLLGLSVEILRKFKLVDSLEFSFLLEKLEWRAIIFYISLFMLVGGLDAGGFIPVLSRRIASLALSSREHGFSLMYWSSMFASSIVEHDAYILAMFKAIKDAVGILGFNPWPLYWAVAWGGTLGSNATVAGAPALYVTIALLEREGLRVRSMYFLKVTVLFTLISSIITYFLVLPIWGYP